MRKTKLALLLLGMLAGCSASDSSGTSSYGAADGGWSSPVGSADMGAANPGGGSFGNVGIGGGQDFAAFRDALEHNLIPALSTLDSGGFFAEHYTSLPAPTCGQTFCLHALLSVAPDLVSDGARTLVQLGMSSPLDPDTVQKPPLDLVVVLDVSGSMQGGSKIDYAKQGLKLLVDQLADGDRLTLQTFSDTSKTLFGPSTIGGQRAYVKTLVDNVVANGGTNIYDALEAGYQAALIDSDETQQRRILFLTDGVPTVGNTSTAAILAMSKSFNEQYLGLTAIGLGTDVDADLLRRLSEEGGGNFYFIEQPAAVTEVFTEELKFFVAPIAYDVQLDLVATGGHTMKEVFGTNLYVPGTNGGQIKVPSVFLVSRQSSAPGPSGGRRGGGAAIIADLLPQLVGAPGPHAITSIDLSYRDPGQSLRKSQHVDLGYAGADGVVPAESPEGWFSAPSMEKNTLMLAFYRAFRGATEKATSGDHAGAKQLLEGFRPRVAARLIAFTDADLADDLALVDRYITVLSAKAP